MNGARFGAMRYCCCRHQRTTLSIRRLLHTWSKSGQCGKVISNETIKYSDVLLKRHDVMLKSITDWQLKAHTRTLSVDDGAATISYTDMGAFSQTPFDQVTVFFIPQVGETRGEFRFMYKRLVASGFRVIACDLRGTGDTYGEFSDFTMNSVLHDLRAVLRHANVSQRVIVMASSTSSEFGVRLSRRSDLGIEALVLVSPFAYQSVWYRIMRLTVQPWLRGKIGVRLLVQLFRSLHFPKSAPADEEAYYDMLGQQLLQSYRMKAVRKLFMQNRSMWRPIVSIDVPVHVVCGIEDPLHSVMLQQRDMFDKHIDADVWYKCCAVPSSGHFPHVENCAYVARVLEEVRHSISQQK